MCDYEVRIRANDGLMSPFHLHIRFFRAGESRFYRLSRFRNRRYCIHEDLICSALFSFALLLFGHGNMSANARLRAFRYNYFLFNSFRTILKLSQLFHFSVIKIFICTALKHRISRRIRICPVRILRLRPVIFPSFQRTIIVFVSWTFALWTQRSKPDRSQ